MSNNSMNIRDHGRVPVQVFLDGEKMLNVVQFRASSPTEQGFVVTCVVAANGTALVGADGKMVTKIHWGKVEVLEA